MEILKGLLQVKVIIAILMTLVFCYLTITGKVNPQDFVTIFSSVLAFFFGHSYGKRSGNNIEDNGDSEDLLRSNEITKKNDGQDKEDNKKEKLIEGNNDQKESKKEKIDEK